MSKQIIVCTAGHVDHGKTSLVKALTGVDCDKHMEEKRRGITINLGFAFLVNRVGDVISFIDVPGHQHFINTMISGASGVDYAMLVVAADDSVMPQTIEHLRIIELLGITKGIVVITKIDLVDEDMLNLCVDEIKDLSKETFLEGSEIFRVSCRTGNGISQLRRHLENICCQRLEHSEYETFRMYIDRVFILQGFGTIITGSVLGGKINRGEKVFAMPANKETKVKQLQIHGSAVEEVAVGERAALNLDISHNDLSVGMLITDRVVEQTAIIDAELKLLPDTKLYSLKSRTKVMLLLGTFKTEAYIKLLSTDIAEDGRVFAQLQLKRSIVPFRKDRFIIRSTSADRTLAGGIVLDPYPLKHVRKTEKLTARLRALSLLRDDDYIRIKVQESQVPVPVEFFSNCLQLSEEHISILVSSKLQGKIFKFGSNGSMMFFCDSHKKQIIPAFFEKLKKIELQQAITYDAIIQETKTTNFFISEEIIPELLEHLFSEQKLQQVHNVFKVNIKADAHVEKISQRVYETFASQNHLGFTFKNIEQYFPNDRKSLGQAIALLVKRGKLIQMGECYISFSFVVACKAGLIKFLKQNKEGITVAEFRDLTGTNRTTAIALFGLFEKEELVYRQGDLRFLTEKII